MKRGNFTIGTEFWCGAKRWRCTDIGTRVIVAVCLASHEVVTLVPGEQPTAAPREVRPLADDPSWLVGPPYVVEECVFDEFDMAGCSLTIDAEAP